MVGVVVGGKGGRSLTIITVVIVTGGGLAGALVSGAADVTTGTEASVVEGADIETSGGLSGALVSGAADVAIGTGASVVEGADVETGVVADELS